LPQDNREYNHKILNEALVKKYLNNAGLFLMIWELLKSSIVDSIKSFFMNWLQDWKITYSEKYKSEVLDLDQKNIFNACCLRSVNMNIITKDDHDKIKELNETRNDIAHRLVDIVSEENKEIKSIDIEVIAQILKKVDLWRLINVEIPTNHSETFDENLDHDAVMSGRVLATEYLLNLHLIK
jgi:hypothetical protein